MNKKFIQILTFSLLSFLTFQKVACASEEITTWVDTKTSMSKLLIDGWQIVSFNRSTAMTQARLFPLSNVNVNQINFNTGKYDNFLLVKNNNFIICWVGGGLPQVQDIIPGTAKSTCVKLN